MSVKEVTEKWRAYISGEDDSTLMQAYERFRKEIGHGWALRAARQVAELVNQGVDFETAYKQVDEKL